MTDPERPFRALARPVTPVEPDPAFAAALRDRLRRALLSQQPAVPARTPTPGGRPAMSPLIPYLAVRDARAAIAWYVDAFGAREVGDHYVMDDDRIGHAELDVAGATLYLADEYPELGLTGPEEGKTSVSLHLTVSDVDAAVARAEAVGATVTRRPADAPYGRTGAIVDPYGHHWLLQTPTRPPEPGPRPGDAVYLTLQVPDGARARDFYEAVLGWSAAPGRVPDGWQVEGTTPMIGIGGGSSEPGTVPMYAVDDIEVAVAAVRTAGGQAGDIERQSYGLSALCRDDQGLPFWLGQLA
ncbi:VOC family protein [Blastococcus jejuensis]|uniref:VOC family protein n=1 Tax=Blastococcus jejuensis TaxID=351224 RepID=A0ABP6PLI0_9ACTN